jgi:hypothetical protein
MPTAGNQYIEVNYDPNGGALVKVDEDLDGRCDYAMIFVIIKKDGIKQLVPLRTGIPCENADILVARAKKYWDAQGLEPMIYDRDLDALVPVSSIKK